MKGKRIFSQSELDAIKSFIEVKKHSESEVNEIKKLIADNPVQREKVKFSIYTIFEYALEFLGWLKIMASPLFIGIVIGLFIYLPAPNDTRLLIASIITFVGLIIGIILATRIWLRKGTMDYLAEIMASHDFDHMNDDNDKSTFKETK